MIIVLKVLFWLLFNVKMRQKDQSRPLLDRWVSDKGLDGSFLLGNLGLAVDLVEQAGQTQAAAQELLFDKRTILGHIVIGEIGPFGG